MLYIKKGWDFPKDGEGVLFLETNLEELNRTNYLGNDLNGIKYEGIDIKIEDLNYDNLIQFKYQFFTKNQIFGTCWANAYSASIYLTNKRILGKKLETFETYRENIIRLASQANNDGAYILNPKVKDFFDNQRLHFKERNEDEARKVIMKGRFVVYNFRLNDKQLENFSNFYKKNKEGILTEDILNNNCEEDKNDSGHAVLLIEVKKDYLRFLNSWGSNWGDKGTFKVKNGKILKPYNTNTFPTFYDNFFMKMN